MDEIRKQSGVPELTTYRAEKLKILINSCIREVDRIEVIESAYWYSEAKKREKLMIVSQRRAFDKTKE